MAKDIRRRTEGKEITHPPGRERKYPTRFVKRGGRAKRHVTDENGFGIGSRE